MGVLERLSAKIIEAGFDAFAIMPAIPLMKMLPILRKAQSEGRYPAFVDKNIRKRIEPRALQQNAQSIISLAVAYNSHDPGPTPPLHGTISRSAWGKDYHRVLDKQMDQIISFLREQFSANECTKAVDTTFLVDRAIAIESGLGYPGDNCAVYVPPFGSWVFLGEILVDIRLPFSPKQAKANWLSPIQCHACISACPTGALIAPGKIVPQRCLSYITQMGGAIPEEFRAKLGNRLWGCDTCQQACPTNKESQMGTHPEFTPKIAPHVALLPLLSMNKQEFKTIFGETSLAWRGKNILQRNACIILGNQGNWQALVQLRKTVQNHPSAIVQEAAAWAIKRIQKQT